MRLPRPSSTLALSLIFLLVVVSASQCGRGQDLSGATLEELIELLDSSAFERRVAATDELIRRGLVNVSRLVDVYRSGPPPEVRARAALILRRLGYQAALRLIDAADELGRIIVELQMPGIQGEAQILDQLARRAEALAVAIDAALRAVVDEELRLELGLLGLNLDILGFSIRKIPRQPNPAAELAMVVEDGRRRRTKIRSILDSLDDIDGDGMASSWELDFGLDPTVDDGDEDADGDGATNREEFDRGTDPTRIGSFPGLG